MEIVVLDHTEYCAECDAELPLGTRARQYGDLYYCNVPKGKHTGPSAQPPPPDDQDRRGQGQRPAPQADVMPASVGMQPVTRAELAGALGELEAALRRFRVLLGREK